MKRSEINAALKEMEQMTQKCGFQLPPFCSFTPEEWREKGHEYDEIRENMLGWDITDYGLGNFDRVGFSLITIRNGNRQKQENTRSHMRKSFCICGRGSIPRCIFTGLRWRILSTAEAGTS